MTIILRSYERKVAALEIKLFDSELKVMDVLWKEGDTPAREIARVLTDELGWNVNTTYTLIKRCI